MSDLKQRLVRLSTAQRSDLAAKLQRMAAPRPGGGTRLVAYVVPEAGRTLKTADLRASLASRLPDYMVPSQIVLLDAMPLTPNGKINREALPKLTITQTDENRYVEPGTDIEKEIARLWTDLLGIEMIGIHDNFFELGGHSLLVIQAIARLRDRYHIDLGVSALFERPTVARLAEYISEKLGGVITGEREELEF